MDVPDLYGYVTRLLRDLNHGRGFEIEDLQA